MQLPLPSQRYIENTSDNNDGQLTGFYASYKAPLAQKEVFLYDTKLYLMARLQFWSSEKYSFIAITPRSTLARLVVAISPIFG